MNREFLDLYNRELGYLREHAREFADEFPGIAERLGGLIEGQTDPMIAGLLEGAAFLAARVQLKLKHEFPEFTQNLLEQLVPNYLAPTPSALLARVAPAFGDAALRDGPRIAAGSRLDATYRERDRQIACRFTTTQDLRLWPFEIAAAEYFSHAAPLCALGVDERDVVTGMRLSLTHRKAADRAAEPTEAAAAQDPETWFSGCALDALPVHLVGPEADAVAIYEQVFADCIGLYLRYLDAYGDPVVVPLGRGCIEPVGFGPNEALIPKDERLFDGFDLLREYFMFPRKFLGFRLTGLAAWLPQVRTRNLDILFTFDAASPQLGAAVRPDAFALYAVPAVNLFEMRLDRVPVEASRHEYHLVADRTHHLDFEPHRVRQVYAHRSGVDGKVPVRPLYAPSGDAHDAGLYYTVRRMPRRRTSRERRYGTASDYTGTDLFLSLIEPAGAADGAIAELSVRALCSNRHLPELLPVGESGADFRFADDVALDVTCLVGPTRPREPVVAHLRSRSGTLYTGAISWRLINVLSLNPLGLVARGAGRGAEALREVLMLFADLSDSAAERRIRGVRSIDSRPVVRRLRQRIGTGTARGTEVTVTLDDKAFEGTGIFLLGAILERFFAEYASLNHFTQTVIRTVERGEIVRWPPRVGGRRLL
ncbi:type VI secretion system baseplate subunit TssF [Methylobacterium sp. NEAU 140]|uniref:type VI secretion system baseplate subunit TssF n=1 Tax=Methylobacterium sp. NEAU 140 TaxID=3064945 RepID=UPI0027358452|nr:type VI secretion system baseplate subunit TssF [Methylobacterium sp. NEAU 140]MDP4024922.1 type VI secretion system baseplate subunit TssF [Methylobacterium sp. NEAU 140]